MAELQQPDVWVKIEHFRRSIMDEARVRRQEIMQKMNEYHAAELDRYKDAAKMDSDMMLREEQEKITLEFSRKLAVKRRELKGSLYEEREKRRQTVFEQAGERLLDFTRKPEYGAFLQRKAKKASALVEGAPLRLLIRPQDMKWKDALEKTCPCTVETANYIRLGGFLAESGTGMLIDETLDSALEERKEWFYSASGLQMGSD
jgi:vacuolar-type H+-ATPase subunit E/Vma4